MSGLDDFTIIESTGDVVTFAKANKALFRSLFKQNISEISVGYSNPGNGVIT